MERENLIGASYYRVLYDSHFRTQEEDVIDVEEDNLRRAKLASHLRNDNPDSPLEKENYMPEQVIPQLYGAPLNTIMTDDLEVPVWATRSAIQLVWPMEEVYRTYERFCPKTMFPKPLDMLPMDTPGGGDRTVNSLMALVLAAIAKGWKKPEQRIKLMAWIDDIPRACGSQKFHITGIAHVHSIITGDERVDSRLFDEVKALQLCFRIGFDIRDMDHNKECRRRAFNYVGDAVIQWGGRRLNHNLGRILAPLQYSINHFQQPGTRLTLW